MTRTPIKDRKLPDYTRGEEIFNMVSHIVGGTLGVAALALCVVFSFIHKNPYAVVSSFIYGFSIIILYTISSVYHGLTPKVAMAKKVMQVIDHCAIFLLIAGTYTPLSLCTLREQNTVLGWVVFGFVWGMSALGTTLCAIDVKKYQKFSMICYLAIGWCAIFTLKPLIRGVTLPGFMFILLGGVAYSVGAVIYALGKRYGKKYMHSIFHLFVVAGTVLQFFAVFFYCI